MSDPKELTSAEYSNIFNAIKKVLSHKANSPANLDLMRIPLAREVYNSYLKRKKFDTTIGKMYLGKAINPSFISELKHDEFDRLRRTYGSALAKLLIIDQNFRNWINSAKADDLVLATGGACALETVDTKNIRYLSSRENGQQLVKQYVEFVVNSFPSWTQITGSLIPAKGVSFFYDESFPWHLKLSKYGLINAERETSNIYSKIYAAVSRYAKLFNYSNIVIRVPFKELNFSDEIFLKWFEAYKGYLKEIETTYNLNKTDYSTADFLRAYILYTYLGPEILNLNKAFIKTKYPDIFKEYKLDKATIHVRGKQIDHLTVERTSSWQYPLLMNYKDKDEKRLSHILAIPNNRYELSIYQWARDNLKDLSTIGFGGFLDSNYKGELIHESSFFTTKHLNQLSNSEVLQNLLESPLRLTAQNTDKVIRFLEMFKNPNAVSFSKDSLDDLLSIKTEISKIERKIDTVQKYIATAVLLEKILSNLNLKNESEATVLLDIKYFSSTEDILFSTLNIVSRLRRTKEVEDILSEHNSSLSKLGVDSLEDIFNVIIQDLRVLTFKNEKKVKVRLDQRVCLMDYIIERLIVLLQKYIEMDTKQVSDMMKKQQENNHKLNLITETIANTIINHKLDGMTMHVHVLPLADNMFVSYMQQLIFIPSIQKTYLEMVEIEQNNNFSFDDKVVKISELTKNVFPIIRACIKYVMKEGEDYPWIIHTNY